MFRERHGKCEEKEKKRYLNFLGGNGSAHGRKRPRPKHSSTPEPPSLQHGSGGGGLDHEDKMYFQVLPYAPRKFPLVAKELVALTKPGPPPIVKHVPVSDRCDLLSSAY